LKEMRMPECIIIGRAACEPRGQSPCIIAEYGN
jgi:hypothetical protein